MASRAIAALSQLGIVRLRQSPTAAATQRRGEQSDEKPGKSPLHEEQALDGTAFETVTGGDGRAQRSTAAPFPPTPASATGRAADGWTYRTLDGRSRTARSRAAACSSPAGAATSSRNISRPTIIGIARAGTSPPSTGAGRAASQGDRPGGHLDSFETLVGDLAGADRGLAGGDARRRMSSSPIRWAGTSCCGPSPTGSRRSTRRCWSRRCW